MLCRNWQSLHLRFKILIPVDGVASHSRKRAGIGRALIEEVAAMGAKVYTCCRTQDKLDAVLADWQAQGLDVHGCTADVSNSDARQRLVDAARSHFDGALHAHVPPCLRSPPCLQSR